MELQTFTRDQQQHETIESVNLEILQTTLGVEEYVAVFFCGDSCKNCDAVLDELEGKIANQKLIYFRDKEPSLYTEESVKKFPAMVFFRNEQPSAYKGDLLKEEDLLEWLTDVDTLETADEFEDVNALFKKIIIQQENVAALFHNDNAKQCVKVLQELETIDDEAHAADIDFVKIQDDKLVKSYGIHAYPALVYFTRGELTIYAIDLKKVPP